MPGNRRFRAVATRSVGRPQKDPAERRDRPVMVKLTAREGASFDELRRKLGGEIEAGESDAVRLALREACERRGLVWPSAQAAPAPAPSPAPAAKKRAKK